MSQSVDAPIRVKGIDHVTLVVKDLDKSRLFYAGLLGMAQVERPNFDFDGLWFQAGDTQIHLILYHDGCSMPGDGNIVAATKASRAHHFAFEVDNAHRASEELLANHVEIRGGPNTRPDGCIQIWCYDPDGYVVELFHRPKAT